MATSQRQGAEQHQQEQQEGPGPLEISEAEMPEQAQDSCVNEGYERWLAQRAQWTSGNRPAYPRPRNLPLVTHDMVLGERPFPRAVPLEAVVECLVELWEEEDSWD
ncbi:hypothetical protein VOLCADRAFT_97887 [Volvox carteri f. nagariensis]|uniref:DUF4050 domain-containing protein n=1 Tax=Volvox carteri f. nagariensis TaxID=3068 RepID=D8UDX0_VOLCA|nr:uncharacterized protein VOLCADRAFT_97887 [Volvox carteri f. nagariensis]EFJ42119.1 hypothetical protein VOLCADRAFT_97887 [Volvox carteri f. nagariensis]|eukprot:XP_002956816.1 hypothetical protein VOLCADRAFT_97887 [Volvox carteri f. nagariensis]